MHKLLEEGGVYIAKAEISDKIYPDLFLLIDIQASIQNDETVL